MTAQGAKEMYVMTEEMKNNIVTDWLVANHNSSQFYKNQAEYLIKLIRTLDSYRQRDEKGRFVRTEI